MKQNVGSVDRVIRIVIAVIVAVIGIVFQSWWGLLALLPLLTAVVGFCPLYLPFGISTKGKAAEK